MESKQNLPVQKWTNSEIGTTQLTLPQRVIQASSGVKIIYIENLRQQFTALLAKFKVMLGLSADMMPTSEEIEVMLNYAQDHWFKSTLEEVELAVVTNLNHENETYVEAYGKLSIKYINDCLFAYKETKRKAILDHKRREEAMKPRTHPEEPDHIRNAKLWAGLVQFTVQNNRIPDLWDWFRCYDHLEAEKGKDWIPLEEKKQIWQDQYDIITRKIDKAKKEAPTLSELRELSDSDLNNQVKNACQRFIVERELAQFIK